MIKRSQMNNIMRPSDGNKKETPEHDKMALWLLKKESQQIVAHKIMHNKPNFYDKNFEVLEKSTVREKRGILSSRILEYDIVDLEFEVVGNGDCDAIMWYRPHLYNGDNSVYAAVIEFKPVIRSGTGTVSQIKKYKKNFRRYITKKCATDYQVKAIDGILITHDPDTTLDPLFEKERIHILRIIQPQQQFFSG